MFSSTGLRNFNVSYLYVWFSNLQRQQKVRLEPNWRRFNENMIEEEIRKKKFKTVGPEEEYGNAAVVE